MGAPITEITIVGGGTAGWLTAAYLNHGLQWGFGRREDLKITLIEAPDVPTIGVGEATVPSLRQTLRLLEISENEFVARTNATFKLGIRFDDWNVDHDGRFRSFVHAFGGGLHVRGRNPAASLLKYGVTREVLGAEPSFENVIGHTPEAAALRKGPKLIGGNSFSGVEQYAYHLDAGAFATFLSEVCVARGVEHVRDTVVGAERDERGLISALRMKDGRLRPVQLVIDCTGFQGLLINKTLEEPFISYSDYLLNDRAIPIQVAHAPEPDLYPATISTARRAGWSWRIPLQTRIGTGYVFSSRFISDQQALDEALAYLGDETLLTDPRVLSMRVGRCNRSWVGNCVAIGLSSGFIEPLESTAIQFIELSCRRLLQFLPSTDFEPALASKFNAWIADLYEEVRDFLGLHFSLNNRTDTPYWIAAREEAKRSDRLNENIAAWRQSLPDLFDHRSAMTFSFWSVCTVLIGKGFYDGPISTGTDLLPPETWSRFLSEWKAIKTAALAAMPDHGELLRSMVSAAEHGRSAGKTPRKPPFTIGGDALSMTSTVMTPIVERGLFHG